MEHQDLQAALAKSQQELERAQEQIAELEALLAELPGIFERKFSQRLEPILERQRLLSADNERLQQGSQREEPLVLPLQPAQQRMGSRVRALWPQNQDPSVAA
ncbi:hypothetical protein [Synechococcus sp. LTW-G]